MLPFLKHHRPPLGFYFTWRNARWHVPQAGVSSFAAFLLATSLLLGGCDTGTAPSENGTSAQTPSIRFEGARHTAKRGARLTKTSERVEVRPKSRTSPISSVQIEPEKKGRADLLFQTSDLGPEDAFSAAALNKKGQVLGRIVHEGVGDGTNRVWADMSGFNPESVTVRFYDGGRLLSERQMETSGEETDSLTIATSSSDPDSWHQETYVDENGEEKTKLVADYTEANSFDPTVGDDSLAATGSATGIGGDPSAKRARLRPASSLDTRRGEEETRTSGMSLRKKSAVRATHVAVVMEGVRPEAETQSVRLTQRGGIGGFTITDERFK